MNGIEVDLKDLFSLEGFIAFACSLILVYFCFYSWVYPSIKEKHEEDIASIATMKITQKNRPLSIVL